MGVVDYGLSDTGGVESTYYYEATQFVSWANFTVLSIGNSNNGLSGRMTIQQNLVAYNVYENGEAGEYWIQNVPRIYNYSSGHYFAIEMLDNLWNFSGPVNGEGYDPLNGQMNSGLTNDCALGSGIQSEEFYYCQSNQEFRTTLPFEIKMTTSTFTVPSGTYSGSSAVKFHVAVYHKNKLVGSITYDTVAFSGSDGGNQPFFLVAYALNPIGLYDDAETVLCGPGGGSTVPIDKIAATLSEAYLNSTVSLTLIPHAWSFGSDTAETVSGVLMSKSSTSDTGIASGGTDNDIQLW